MDGSLSLESALEQRLQVINCQPGDIQAFLKAHPPESRLFPVGRRVGEWVAWVASWSEGAVRMGCP